MCTICADDSDRLREVVRRVNGVLSITDKDGKDMIYERLSEKEIQDL